MNLPRHSIRWPVAVTMICLSVLIMGLIAVSDIPLAMLPDLELPFVAIVTTYQGAGPREVENLITRPIEEAVATLSGLDSVVSTSSRGVSTVLAQFQWGTDMEFAALDVREAVELIRPNLPSDADAPRVFRFDPARIPVMAITLGGDLGPAELRRLAEDVVQPRLERLEGVASVGVGGGLEREIQVVLHPGRLQAFGISVEQVMQALQGDNIDRPGGTGVLREREYVVRTTGEFRSLEEIADLRIPLGDGSTVPLRHVGEVRDTYKEQTVLTRLNFEPAVGLSIQKEDRANTVQVSRRVREELERIKEDLGGQVEAVIVFDQAEMIEDSLRNVAENGAVGGLIAAGVLFAFLRNLRATAIVATAIPLSIVVTFVMMYFADMSLNIISLGGLALGVGMLVDNAIVVLENVFRHRTEGAPSEVAAENGANEVGMAVLASTLTTLAVFLPVVFTEGMAKQLFQDMAVTVSFSLTASLLVSLSVVPLLAARWLKKGFEQYNTYAAGTGMGGMQEAYARVLAWSIRRRGLVLLAVGALFAGSLALAPRIGTEFMPQVDQGVFSVSVELPTGSTLADTEAVTRRLEEWIATLPEVEHVYSRIGAANQFDTSGTTPERATIQVDLVPLSERSRSAFELMEVVRGMGSQIPGAKVSVWMESGFGGSKAPIEVELRGDDEEAMVAALEAVAEVVRSVPGTREVKTSVEDERPEYRVEIRRERARELGVSVPQIASAVRTAVDGEVVTRYRTGEHELDVRLLLDGGTGNDLETLRYVPVASPAGGIVPLGEVVRFTPAGSPRDLERRNQSRTMTVTGQLFGRDLGSVMADIRAGVAALSLPAGVQVSYEGEAQQMQESFGDLLKALLLGVFLVYAVMASQFNSFRHPLVIMFTVPLGGIGALWGLFLTGHALSVSAFIGLIMLAGIVVNNGIVLVDYVNQLRQRGMEREEALITAGRTRLRPVLMTALTTILGMLPLALGIGEGAELQAPLATVVIFGLLFSTVLTLVVVPVMYLWIEDFGARWFRRGEKTRELGEWTA